MYFVRKLGRYSIATTQQLVLRSPFTIFFTITFFSLQVYAADENISTLNNGIATYFNNIPGHPDPVPVKGKVIDEKGEPLSGVSIRLKNTETGVTTGADGSFSINLPDVKTSLVISHVGYVSQEVVIKGTQVITISLVPEQNNLNEVVVVGYGTQKRSEVSGAVASLPAKNTDEKPIQRIEQALIGQMAGVQVRQQTGMAGSGLSILVRGSGSITAGNEPLYVVDGFPLDVSGQNSDGGFSNNPLDNLNPNDIESIQVLKDAAAGAIYGSRAANGVVMITTKKGQSGKMKIGINARSGVSKVAKKLDILSPGEWVSMATEVANTAWVKSGAGRTARPVVEPAGAGGQRFQHQSAEYRFRSEQGVGVQSEHHQPEIPEFSMDYEHQYCVQ